MHRGTLLDIDDQGNKEGEALQDLTLTNKGEPTGDVNVRGSICCSVCVMVELT